MISTHWSEPHEPSEAELRGLDVLARLAADLIERKVAEEALRRSEERLRRFYESNMLGIFYWNINGDITDANDKFLSIVGYSREELVSGQIDWVNMTPPEYRHLDEASVIELKTTGFNNEPFEKVYLHKNGTHIPIIIAGAMLDDERINGVAFVLEITERKRAELALKALNDDLDKLVQQRTTQLREKDQILLMQSRQAAMGEMIGNISHQWRQPLNILGMQLQQLQLFYELGKFSKELLDKNVAGSMEVIQYMSKTIDDFRNFFRPDKEKSRFKILESINTCLLLMEGSLRNPLIDVDVVANDDPLIYGFPNEFAQVILNIMNNARDAIVERNVPEPKVTITIVNEGGCAVVTVTDNAGGIPEDIINKVFDPYFTTKGPQQGTGVGLFMSKAIIEKNMGGRLTAVKISGGTEFRIEVERGNPA